jgi:hypothetical protein
MANDIATDEILAALRSRERLLEGGIGGPSRVLPCWLRNPAGRSVRTATQFAMIQNRHGTVAFFGY